MRRRKRIALLIGNQGYGSEVGRPAYPHNDVALLEKTLKDLRFEVTTVRDVIVPTNASRLAAYSA